MVVVLIASTLAGCSERATPDKGKAPQERAADTAHQGEMKAVDFSRSPDDGVQFPSSRHADLFEFLRASKVVSGEEQCAAGDNDTLIFGSATAFDGSFTRDAAQQLVAVSFGVCNQPQWERRDYLVVFEGENPVGQIADACSSGIALRPDPDNPGLRVAIGTCGGTGQGITEEKAVIYGLRRNAFGRISDLGRVYSDNCGVADKGRIVYSVMSLRPGDTYGARTFEMACEAAGKTGRSARLLHDGFVSDGDTQTQ